jgi:hypothetical protein
MSESITVSKRDLYAALLRWEQEARDGKCLTREAAEKLSAQETAQASTDHLWSELTGVGRS